MLFRSPGPVISRTKAALISTQALSPAEMVFVAVEEVCAHRHAGAQKKMANRFVGDKRGLLNGVTDRVTLLL